MAATKLTAGTSIDSPGPIYGTQMVKYWPLLTQKNVTLQAIQLTALLSPPFLLLARATAARAVCQSSELQQTSNAPTPPTSSEASCHSPPWFSFWQMVCCVSAEFCALATPYQHWNCPLKMHWFLQGAGNRHSFYFFLFFPLKNCILSSRLFLLKESVLQLWKEDYA